MKKKRIHRNRWTVAENMFIAFQPTKEVRDEWKEYRIRISKKEPSKFKSNLQKAGINIR